AKDAEPLVEVVLPQLRVPVDHHLAAPDVIDEDVEPPVLAVDALDQRADLLAFEVIDLDRDPGTARGVDELRGLLDRLWPVVLTAALPRRASRRVDRRAGLAQRDRDAAPTAARRSRDERDLPLQWSFTHARQCAARSLTSPVSIPAAQA